MMEDTFAIFEQTPNSNGSLGFAQGYMIYQGDFAGAIDMLKLELSQHPNAQGKYLLVKIVPFRADIEVSVNIQAKP